MYVGTTYSLLHPVVDVRIDEASAAAAAAVGVVAFRRFFILLLPGTLRYTARDRRRKEKEKGRGGEGGEGSSCGVLLFPSLSSRNRPI